MKKYISIALLVLFIVPSVALASWWNPFTWKVFKKKEVVSQPKVQESDNKTAEEKISDLQKQLDDLKNVQSKIVPKIEPKLNSKNSTAQKINQNTVEQIASKTQPSVFVDDNIGVRCKVYMQGDVNIGESVRAELSDLNIGISKYDVIWDKNNLKKLMYFNEATFIFDTPGNKIISALVVRKADGAQKKINCTEIVVENEDVEQSEEDRKNSTECKSVTSTLNEVRAEMKPLQDKRDAEYESYLKTGNYVSPDSDSLNKLANLSIRSSALLTKYAAVCENVYPTPPKTTTCNWIGNTLNCTGY